MMEESYEKVKKKYGSCLKKAENDEEYKSCAEDFIPKGKRFLEKSMKQNIRESKVGKAISLDDVVKETQMEIGTEISRAEDIVKASEGKMLISRAVAFSPDVPKKVMKKFISTDKVRDVLSEDKKRSEILEEIEREIGMRIDDVEYRPDVDVEAFEQIEGEFESSEEARRKAKKRLFETNPETKRGLVVISSMEEKAERFTPPL